MRNAIHIRLLNQSILSGFCRNGDCSGLVPLKLPNRRLRRDLPDIQRFVSGEVVMKGGK